MKLRTMAAALVIGVLAVLAGATSGGTAAPVTTHARSITVWLMVDAQSGWPNAVAAANKAFKAAHPGVDVNIEYQTWTTHLQKLDATLAGGNVPDVVEMGNTEMMRYMVSGAFANQTAQKATFPNSKTWIKALAAQGVYNGKLFGIPYYAGTRMVIYRTDFYKKAGITKKPTSLAQFLANGKKLMRVYGNDKTFSAYYLAGRDWYTGLSFVYDQGGKIAVKTKGRWVGALNSPKAIKGLTQLKSVFLSLSRASKTTDEAHPFPTTPFSQGHAAAFSGPAWQWNYALDPKAGNPALAPYMNAYALPSHAAGRAMPGFVGGSLLAIPAATKERALAQAWIRAFTSTSVETMIAKAGNIANTTKLLTLAKSDIKLAAQARAIANGWAVPQAQNWVTVENQNVLQNMLTNIYTGKLSVKAAATAASKQITSILNAST